MIFDCKGETGRKWNITSRFLSSLVSPSDLSLMSYYRHHDRVNTSAVATAGYDGNDKWTEQHSARAQYHLWRVRHRVSLLPKSQETSLEGLPSTISPPDIFLVLSYPRSVVFLSFSWPPPIKMQANFPAH